jgi:hypothetical protein
MGSKSAAQDDTEKGKVEKGIVLVWNCYVHFFEILLPSTLDNASPPDGDDPSVKIWNLSFERTSEHDIAMFHRMKGDMDGILIYVRFKTAH